MAPRTHRTLELQSIALHRLIADRLDDVMLAHARARVAGWIADGGPVHETYARRWRDLLEAPSATLAARLVEDSEEMRDLRQNTPFAGVLSDRERWKVIAEVD